MHEGKRMRCILSKVCSRWRKQTLSEAVAYWSDQIQLARRMLRTSHAVIKRWRSVHLLAGFMAIKHHALSLRVLRITARKIVGRWQHLCLMRAVSTWSTHASRESKLAYAAWKIAKRGTRMRIKSCLGTMERVRGGEQAAEAQCLQGGAPYAEHVLVGGLGQAPGGC